MKDLIKRRKKLHAKMQRILSEAKGEALAEADSKLYTKYDRQYDEVNEQIKQLEKLEAREKELDKPLRKALVPGQKENKDVKLKDEEVKRYSLFKVLRALETGDFKEAKFEVEISRKLEEASGTTARGILVPPQIQQRAVLSKANSGALVGTDHRADLYIEALTADSFVMQQGVKLIPNLVGEQDIPRALGGMEFAFVGEDGESPLVDASYDNITLTPHTATGSIAITRKLLLQSNPYVEDLIEADIRSGMALLIDKMVLAGDGTNNQPVGILYTTGVNTITVADANGIPTFKEAVDFETELAENNALRGTPCYVTRPNINGAWKTTPTDAGSGVMMNQNNMVNGYKSIPTTLIPAGKTIFGNFTDVLVGMWSNLDLVLDTATMAKKGGLVIRAWQDIDVGVRHAQSFSITEG